MLVIVFVSEVYDKNEHVSNNHWLNPNSASRTADNKTALLPKLSKREVILNAFISNGTKTEGIRSVTTSGFSCLFGWVRDFMADSETGRVSAIENGAAACSTVSKRQAVCKRC